MYIQFEDDITVYSFNKKELSKLEEIYKVFQEYGKADLKSIRIILSSEFAIKIIPLFYKVHTKMVDNVKIDLPEKYVEGILSNSSVYVEYGLLMKLYCNKNHSNMLPDDIPEYLINEINKYEIVNDRGHSYLTYKRPRYLYAIVNKFEPQPYRPYQPDKEIIYMTDEEKNEKYW